MRRIITILSIGAVSLVASTWGATNPCPGGASNTKEKDHPIVCIDPNTLEATPSTVHVHRDRTIQFFFNNNQGRLDVGIGPGRTKTGKVLGKGKAFDPVRQDGAHAWVHTKTKAPYGRYPYTIRNLEGKKAKDPDIMIEP
jgi:hypothetical protein